MFTLWQGNWRRFSFWTVKMEWRWNLNWQAVENFLWSYAPKGIETMPAD